MCAAILYVSPITFIIKKLSKEYSMPDMKCLWTFQNPPQVVAF